MSTTVASISGRISLSNGQLTTNTHHIAAEYGKQHHKVMAIIRQRMAEAGDWGVANFRDTQYTNPQNGQTYQVIEMTKKGFHFAVGKFTGVKAVKHQIAFADEFERMEESLRNPAPAQTISLDQQQTIKELAAVVNAATGQSFGEIYARLHNRFRVPRYQELHPSQFVEACEYLRSKPDGNMMAKLVMDLFGRPRILLSVDHNGRTVSQLLRDDDVVMPYSAIPSRIESGEIPSNVVRSIASQALNRMTGGQLAMI